MKGMNFVSPPPPLYHILTRNFCDHLLTKKKVLNILYIYLFWKGKKVNIFSFIYTIKTQGKVNVKLTGTKFRQSIVPGNTKRSLLMEKKKLHFNKKLKLRWLRCSHHQALHITSGMNYLYRQQHPISLLT